MGISTSHQPLNLVKPTAIIKPSRRGRLAQQTFMTTPCWGDREFRGCCFFFRGGNRMTGKNTAYCNLYLVNEMPGKKSSEWGFLVFSKIWPFLERVVLAFQVRTVSFSNCEASHWNFQNLWGFCLESSGGMGGIEISSFETLNCFFILEKLVEHGTFFKRKPYI